MRPPECKLLFTAISEECGARNCLNPLTERRQDVKEKYRTRMAPGQSRGASLFLRGPLATLWLPFFLHPLSPRLRPQPGREMRDGCSRGKR